MALSPWHVWGQAVAKDHRRQQAQNIARANPSNANAQWIERCAGLSESSFRIGRSAYAYLSASRLFACFGLPSWTPRAFAAASEFSPLAQAVVPVSQQGREQVADDTARAGLDLDGHRHAGRQIDQLVVDLHLRAVERDARRIDQLLARRLARGFVVLRRAARLVLGLFSDDGSCETLSTLPCSSP